MAQAKIPITAELTKALKALLGRGVEVTLVETQHPTETIVRYVDGANNLVCALTIGRQLAFTLGGALAMIPPGTVEEAIKSKQENPELEDNFREVVNVLATAAANVLGCRAVLESVSQSSEHLVRTARQVRAAEAHWQVVRIAIEDYKDGPLAIALLPPEATAEANA